MEPLHSPHSAQVWMSSRLYSKRSCQYGRAMHLTDCCTVLEFRMRWNAKSLLGDKLFTVCEPLEIWTVKTYLYLYLYLFSLHKGRTHSTQMWQRNQKVFFIYPFVYQLQAPSTEEKACGCQLMASIVCRPKAIDLLLKQNVIKITAPLFLDASVDVQKNSLGALRYFGRGRKVYGISLLLVPCHSVSLITIVSGM